MIVVAVRWYLRHGLSYRDVEELLDERGIDVDHVTGQRIQAGIVHAGRTPSVEAADHTIRVYEDGGTVLADVPRTTTKSITRFKVRKPEPPRRVV